MPKFIIERTVGKLTEDQVAEALRRAQAVADELPQVKWIRTYYADAEGKMYCEY